MTIFEILSVMFQAGMFLLGTINLLLIYIGRKNGKK